MPVKTSCKTMTGKQIPIELPDTATVKDLIDYISDKEGIPAPAIRLIHSGVNIEGADYQNLKLKDKTPTPGVFRGTSDVHVSPVDGSTSLQMILNLNALKK